MLSLLVSFVADYLALSLSLHVVAAWLVQVDYAQLQGFLSVPQVLFSLHPVAFLSFLLHPPMTGLSFPSLQGVSSALLS